MKIASWNIAGGHTVASHEHFDYWPEDLAYFVEQLKKLDPDVVCLQETHTSHSRSIAREIAGFLGQYQVFDSEMSPSHIDPSYRLGMAILSRIGMRSEKLSVYPDPDFELLLPSGKEAATHPKGVQTVTAGGTCVGNTHMLPLVVFGYDYRVEPGKSLALKIGSVLEMALRAPAILCGDFGMSNAQETVYASVFAPLSMRNALRAEATYHRPSEVGGVNRPDSIFYTADSLVVAGSGVVQTQTDHYLTWAEINQKEA